MSFILEALRKSENERRMESAPQVMRVPLTVGRQRLPTWAMLLIVVLCVAVAALAALAWRQIYTPVDNIRSGSAPAALIERREPPMPALGQPVIPDESANEPVLDSESASPAAAVVTQQTAASESREVRQADETQTPPTSRTSSPTAREPVAVPVEIPAESALPSLAALRAEGVSVPSLDLQLHVYSTDRGSRFVFVNGNRFGEGDEVAPGTRLVRIAPEGAVIRFNGREFLLTAN